ncbi:MAG: 5-(carboxyamino)imidazole ribonucleotide synthase [Pseudomonadales bacterium]|nr:5-(carboxyamino)imidazole ribonucleotide synthase [Pseudomonadales bacterium]MBP9034275.1 5-(carboxyamino)imidazole ribonucleotide synthase [Pseudomonadales bacterium]
MILPPATLGVLGGGQLGHYFVLAARELGYHTLVLDPDPRSVAGAVADEHLVGAYDDPLALARVAGRCAAVTTEFESVPAAALAQLERAVPVRPGSTAVAICQDRSAEKGFLRLHALPHAPWTDILREEDCEHCAPALFPGILKVARCGYDGKGQARVADRAGLRVAFHDLGARACVLERLLPLDGELSVVLARDAAGNTRCFPPTANHHRGGILDRSMAPMPRGALADAAPRAQAIAAVIAERMDYVGTLGVEFFLSGGELLVNEIAPRPHNSGHYTLDACVTNQFEQQVRTLCGLPLGDTEAHCAAVCVNLLGDLWYPDGTNVPREPDWRRLLERPGLRLHLYGKDRPRPGRKMGHFTVIGRDPHEVQRTAMAARAAIGIRDECS